MEFELTDEVVTGVGHIEPPLIIVVLEVETITFEVLTGEIVVGTSIRDIVVTGA